MSNGPTLEEVFSPMFDSLVARIATAVRNELKKSAPSSFATDRSLTKAEVAALLGLKENTLMIKVQNQSVPAPYTVRGEAPRWSAKTIERYMSGEWGSRK